MARRYADMNTGIFNPVTFNEATCTGCNRCVEVCLMEILAANPEKGKPPLVTYADECAYDGACWMQCPQREKGAIVITPPLPMRVSILRGGKR
jgi:NAD-dependent dihydropyrimidine dehydrogenase PreA subunit